MTADRIRSNEMVHAGMVGPRKFKECCSQVGDVDRATHIVSEQHSGSLARGESVHQPFMKRSTLSEDQ